MPWLLTIQNFPAPENRQLTPEKEFERATLLQSWTTHIGPLHGDGNGDYEDFWEQAYRLQAALDSFGADNIWLFVPGLRDGKALHLGMREVIDQENLRHLPVYGAQPRVGHHSTMEGPQARLADEYARYRAFTKNARREVHLCGFNVPGSDLVERLVEMASRGKTNIFLKVTLPKFGIFRLTLPAGASEEEVRTVLGDQMDYGLIYLEGLPGAFLVQETVPMYYEYRVFVVDGKAVTGAGAIEEHTPLDNRGLAFSTMVREDRAARSDIEDSSALVRGLLLPFARMVIDQLSDEVPELQNYTLDVAVGADSRPLVVELNSMLNSGFYASRPGLVTDSLATGRLSKV